MRKAHNIDIQYAGIRIYLCIPVFVGSKVEATNNSLMPSLLPRIAAAVFVVLFIGSIGLASIGVVELLGSALAHGNSFEHADGQIVAIGPAENFVLETASGKRLSFDCSTQCRASLWHMQRHMREHAHTDVYYIDGPGNSLMALDVD